MHYLARARSVLAVEASALRAVGRQLDRAFDDAVETVVECLRKRGKVVVVGIGKSGNVGRKIAATLTSTGTTSVLLDAVDALHGDLGIVDETDVVLALSYSGETDELIHLLPGLKRLAWRVVAMTGAPRSTIARHSDLVLNVRVPREACPFNLAPTASTTAMMALGDALAVVVMEARGFTKRMYARYHPAGAIGRALLLTVADVMRTGVRNPVCNGKASVREALLVMTRAKAGSVAIVGPSGKLVGVFTDGDFRRHMARDPGLLDRPLSAVMTRKPITVRSDALAAEALRVFHQKSIDDLVVVNDRREPVGLVDLQDLPRLKLV
ncbi:MAG: KpsF/GutQ family sugar-phosphate isomerase [Verrucomicrobiales bacterium]|nr:KpsF/GutQ family sugar-phosphate isomerase [Verrucomicrobiales bacterium]